MNNIIFQLTFNLKIPFREACVLYIIYLEEMELKIDNKKPVELLYQYEQEIEHIGKEDIENLLKEDLIMPESSTSKTIDSYILTDKGVQMFIENTYEAFEELVQAYPRFLDSGGRKYPLKAIKSNKHDLAEEYTNRIQHSSHNHREVLYLVEKGYDLLNISLENFVNSEFWKDIKAELTTETTTGHGTKRIE